MGHILEHTPIYFMGETVIAEVMRRNQHVHMVIKVLWKCFPDGLAVIVEGFQCQ